MTSHQRAEWHKPLGGAKLDKQTGATRRDRNPISTGATTILSSTSPPRCPGVLRMGGKASADRGRVGVRGARWPRESGVSLGGRARTRRRASNERVAGHISSINARADGYIGTCPVDSYEPNGYSLYNATGNVWEWCADWYSRDYHTRDKLTNPIGPSAGTRKTSRGGSYLCHASYCRRYRVAARNSLEPESTTGNVGFRCVTDARS